MAIVYFPRPYSYMVSFVSVSCFLLFCRLIMLSVHNFHFSYHIAFYCFLYVFPSMLSFKYGCGNHITQHELGAQNLYMV